MESKQLNIGRAGEHLVMSDLLANGYNAMLTDQGMNYDVVIDRGGKLIRLQVKTTEKPGRMNKAPGSAYASSTYLFHAKRAGRGGARLYGVAEFDAIAFVALDTKQIAYVPFDSVITKTIIMRDRRQKYRQNAGKIAPYIDEFPLEKMLDSLP